MQNTRNSTRLRGRRFDLCSPGPKESTCFSSTGWIRAPERLSAPIEEPERPPPLVPTPTGRGCPRLKRRFILTMHELYPSQIRQAEQQVGAELVTKAADRLIPSGRSVSRRCLRQLADGERRPQYRPAAGPAVPCVDRSVRWQRQATIHQSGQAMTGATPRHRVLWAAPSNHVRFASARGNGHRAAERESRYPIC